MPAQIVCGSGFLYQIVATTRFYRKNIRIEVALYIDARARPFYHKIFMNFQVNGVLVKFLEAGKRYMEKKTMQTERRAPILFDCRKNFEKTNIFRFQKR